MDLIEMYLLMDNQFVILSVLANIFLNIFLHYVLPFLPPQTQTQGIQKPKNLDMLIYKCWCDTSREGKILAFNF